MQELSRLRACDRGRERRKRSLQRGCDARLGWHEQLADLAERLVEAMLRDASTRPYLCVDATGVLVQAEEQCRRAPFWVLVAPGRHVLYRYSHKHDSEAVDHLLAGDKEGAPLGYAR